MSPMGNGDALKLSEEEIYRHIVESCGTNGGPVIANFWFDIYWTASWVNALLAARTEPAATVLEIGAGMSSNFIRAASGLLGSRGRFIAVNLNRKLSESFQNRNRQLPIRMRFLEHDALYIRDHLAEGSCSFVAFNHQINDMIQTILYEATGRKTEDGDWYDMAPEMIRLVKEAHDTCNMETTVRPRFLKIIESCCVVLKTGGVMGFNNAVTTLLLRLGYTEELLGDFIALARRWISEEIDSLTVERFSGFDEKWWLFVRKV